MYLFHLAHSKTLQFLDDDYIRFGTNEGSKLTPSSWKRGLSQQLLIHIILLPIVKKVCKSLNVS